MNDPKSLFCLRVCAVCCAGLLALAVVCAVLLIPQAQQAMQAITATAENLKDVDWTAMTDALTQSLSSASHTLDQMDVGALNQAIRDLQTVIAPLAKLLG